MCVCVCVCVCVVLCVNVSSDQMSYTGLSTDKVMKTLLKLLPRSREIFMRLMGINLFSAQKSRFLIKSSGKLKVSWLYSFINNIIFPEIIWPLTFKSDFRLLVLYERKKI